MTNILLHFAIIKDKKSFKTTSCAVFKPDPCNVFIPIYTWIIGTLFIREFILFGVNGRL
jgi:hypothetical protein